MRVYCRALHKPPNTGKGFFAHRLALYLKDLGVKFVEKGKEHDVDLAISPNHGPADGRRYVLRLDGVYWGSKKDPQNKIIAKHFGMAHGIIFQSEFCKCSAWVQLPNHGVTSKAVNTVILNGADPRFYSNIKPAKRQFKYQLIASARWRRHKRLKEAIKMTIEMGEDYGIWVAGDPDYTVTHPRIMYLGRISQEKLASYYRGADAMLHLSAFDPCPNSVAECIAAGTPVLCVNSGGARELVGNMNGLVSKADTPFDYLPTDLKAPRPFDMDKAMKNLRQLIRSGKRANPSTVDIKKTAGKYLKFLEEVASSR